MHAWPVTIYERARKESQKNEKNVQNPNEIEVKHVFRFTQSRSLDCCVISHFVLTRMMTLYSERLFYFCVRNENSENSHNLLRISEIGFAHDLFRFALFCIQIKIV